MEVMVLSCSRLVFLNETVEFDTSQTATGTYLRMEETMPGGAVIYAENVTFSAEISNYLWGKGLIVVIGCSVPYTSLTRSRIN